MKKFVSVILAICLCCAWTVPAAASSDTYAIKDPSSPLWNNLNYATCTADIIDGYLCIDAELQSYSSMLLRITARVSAPGMTTETFTASKTGTYLSFYEEMPADEDLTYTITFTYNAGGETHTESIRV